MATTLATSINAMARRARDASLRMQKATDEERRRAVAAFGQRLQDHVEDLAAANRADMDACRPLVEAGEMSPALFKRLEFQEDKIAQTVRGVAAVAELPDPLGRTLRATRLDEDLTLYQVTVPMGVVACAFEARPDAGIQIVSLAVRSGNAVLLKGGREAQETNRTIQRLAREALHDAGLPSDAVQFLEGREELQALLALDQYVDLIIPRGSYAFVRYIKDHTRIPVLGHADGICHTFVDAHADLEKALPVCVDAKIDYPAACNATEAFLVHRDVAAAFVPRLVAALRDRHVVVHADADARRLAPETEPATDDAWGHEYGDLACAIRVVGSLDEAIDHINRYGSKHTDAILTQDREAARKFVEGVDAAGVYVNASTRFADGYRYGLGAEVGISTGKIHHRGPVGVEGLTSQKWILLGDGHTAAQYQGADARAFLHQPLEEEYHGP